MLSVSEMFDQILLRDKLFLMSSQDCHGNRMVMIVCKFGETHHGFFSSV